VCPWILRDSHDALGLYQIATFGAHPIIYITEYSASGGDAELGLFAHFSSFLSQHFNVPTRFGQGPASNLPK